MLYNFNLFQAQLLNYLKKQQNAIEDLKDDNEEVEFSKNEVAMETVEIN